MFYLLTYFDLRSLQLIAAAISNKQTETLNKTMFALNKIVAE